MTALPTKIAKRIAGACLYSGCSDSALDGSDYCATHDAHEKGRDASKKARRRKRLAEAGLCIAGCGRKVGRRRRADGSMLLRRCRSCAKAHRESARIKSGVPGTASGVPGGSIEGSRWVEQLEQSPDGIPRVRRRFVGQGKKGRQPIAQLDQQDLDEALRCFRRGADALARCESPEIQALPRIQRQDIRAAALRELERATDWIEEVRQRHGAKSWNPADRVEDE